MSFLRVKAASWHKSRWCRWFGHRVSGYGAGAPYLRKERRGATDGLGVSHTAMAAECDKCGKFVTVGMIHERY